MQAKQRVAEVCRQMRWGCQPAPDVDDASWETWLEHHAEWIEALPDFRTTERKCDECGDWMVLRDGKFGPFWGCASYPQCKFTQPVKGEADG